MLICEKYRQREQGKVRVQHRARIVNAENGNTLWVTSEGYDNAGDLNVQINAIREFGNGMPVRDLGEIE